MARHAAERLPDGGARILSKAGGSKAAILAAARAEFSARGLQGARVNEIAARSGMNKQLIYYYFGSKEALYRAALEDSYSEIRSQEADLRLADLPPREAMTALIAFSFDFLAAHPEFVRLLNHENAQGAEHARASDVIRDTNSPLVDMIGTALERGTRAGVFRAGIDAVELYVSIAGMSYFFFSNLLTLSAIFGRDLSSRRAQRAYRQHVIDFAMAALRP